MVTCLTTEIIILTGSWHFFWYGLAISLAYHSGEEGGYFTRSNDFYLSMLRCGGGGGQYHVIWPNWKKYLGLYSKRNVVYGTICWSWLDCNIILCRFQSRLNTYTMGNSMPVSTLTQCQSRLYPQSGTKNLTSVITLTYDNYWEGGVGAFTSLSKASIFMSWLHCYFSPFLLSLLHPNPSLWVVYRWNFFMADTYNRDPSMSSTEILEQSMGDKNRVGIGVVVPTRQADRIEFSESIPGLLNSLKIPLLGSILRPVLGGGGGGGACFAEKNTKEVKEREILRIMVHSLCGITIV